MATQLQTPLIRPTSQVRSSSNPYPLVNPNPGSALPTQPSTTITTTTTLPPSSNHIPLVNTTTYHHPAPILTLSHQHQPQSLHHHHHHQQQQPSLHHRPIHHSLHHHPPAHLHTHPSFPTPSTLGHPFPAPHLMLSAQAPYSFTHQISSQLPLFSASHPILPHHPLQLDLSNSNFPLLPPRRPSSGSHHSSVPSSPSEPLFHPSQPPTPPAQFPHKPQPVSYPQPFYAQRPTQRSSNASLPSSHHSRPSLGTVSSRPPSLHAARPRTDSAQSDRAPPPRASSRSRRDSDSSRSPRHSPRLQPHDSRSSRSPTPTNGTVASLPAPTVAQAHRPQSHPRPSAMVRKPSPLAHGGHSPAPPPGASPAAVPAPASPRLAPSLNALSLNPSSNLTPTEEAGEGSEETASEPDPDPRPLDQRTSTPGTSVDSTASHPAPPTFNTPTPTQPKPRVGLSHKLRRALSIGALNETMIQSAIPEAGALRQGSGAIGSKPASASALLSPHSVGPSHSLGTDGLAKPGRIGAGRRFGILNGRANASTDNLSISSTVSSASVMIRKLGTIGRSARRSTVVGLTKIFKDKKDNDGVIVPAPAPDRDRFSEAEEDAATEDGDERTKRKNGTLTDDLSGMTPAAAFILRQKQQYAQQEAEAASASGTPTNSGAHKLAPASSTSASKKTDRPTPPGSNNGERSASDARKKMIEKEKEKLKSKKGWRWGFGSNVTDAPSGKDAALAGSAAEAKLGAESGDEDTLRGPEVSKKSDSSRKKQQAGLESAEDGSDPKAEASDQAEETTRMEELNDGGCPESVLEEYDAASLLGNGGPGATPNGRAVPPKDSVPKKGILKNGRNFSQNEFLQNSGSVSTPPISTSSTTQESAKEDEVAPPTLQTLVPAGPLSLDPAPDVRSSPSSGSTQLTLAAVPLPPAVQSKLPQNRRATFAQNLSVHSTWPPALYDRRGEPATCNRLTPTLAQRIKEELNAFKMEEMEVHYASRVHTHFFV